MAPPSCADLAERRSRLRIDSQLRRADRRGENRAGRDSARAELASAPNGLASLPGVHDLTVHDHRVKLQVDTAELDSVLRQLSTLGVRSLISQPPTLEELFLRHYEKETASR